MKFHDQIYRNARKYPQKKCSSKKCINFLFSLSGIDGSGGHGTGRSVRRQRAGDPGERPDDRDSTGRVDGTHGMRRLWRTSSRTHRTLRRWKKLALEVSQMLCLCQTAPRSALLFPQGDEALLQARLRTVSFARYIN